MKTLITGATGFLGSHLAAELCRKQDPRTIRVFAQSRSEALAALGVEVVTGSITVAADVARAVAGVTHIYHLAGQVSRKPEDAHKLHAVHVDGTRLLCEAARAAKVKRIVLASTSGTIAVSEREDEKPDEGCGPPLPLIGRWPYYASKYYQEETARHGCGKEIELVTVNPSLLLGPGDHRLSSTRDVLSFLARDIPVIPSGGLNFVDVRDIAAAMPAAMERGRPGERYLLGGYNWSFAEYFGRLERISKVSAPRLKAPRGRLPFLASQAQAAIYKQLGRTPPVEPASVEMASHFWYFDSTKAIEELGFTVREATETLFDTVAYVRAHFLNQRPLKSADASKPSGAASA